MPRFSLPLALPCYVLCALLLAGCATPAPVPGQLFRKADASPLPLAGQLPGWERVLQKEQANPSFVTEGFAEHLLPQGHLTIKYMKEWHSTVSWLRQKSLQQKIQVVNDFFNRWPFKDDAVVWGRDDYWATIPEFLVRSGDCEDYAMTKYFALRSLDVPAEAMRLVGVYNRRKGEYHAVLVVFDNDIPFVLDNRTNTVAPSASFTNYTLRWSASDQSFWRHTPSQK